MGQFDKKVNGEGRRRPAKKKFTPSFESFEENPQEEELDKEEQKRAAEQAKKPKVPKRAPEAFGFRVEKKKSKAPGLPTIQEVDERGQQQPDQTPARRNNGQGQKR